MRGKRGFTSFVVLGTMFVLLILALGLAGLTTNTLRRADRETRYQRAFDVAQAGLEYETAIAYEAAENNYGDFVARSEDISSALTDISGGGTVTATVQPAAYPSQAWVTCTATVAGRTRSVRLFVTSKDVSIWNNAIFAGTGASGQAINGNVDIRGSVHILGDGEYYSDLNGNGHWDPAEAFTDKNKNKVWDPGEVFVDANSDGVWNSMEPYNDTNANGAYDPPITTTELNTYLGGNAYIGNHYSGMPADLEALVPAAPRVNGIETLGAEVRVKHGLISINGSAEIGSDGSIDSGTSKGKIDGSFVNDGYTGNAGAASVHSDNGVTNAYDVAHLDMAFPVVAGIGAEEYKAKDGTTWDIHEDFLEARSMNVPISAISSSTGGFTYGPDAFGNSIMFMPKSSTTPSTLIINGIIRFPGDVRIGDKKETIRYMGSGTVYSRRDINISANLLPADGYKFPTTARIGLLAMRNMGLATGSGDSQLSMSGAFYAQGTIISAKQNQIAGTFVANFFDMGTNVPNIYQVPTLVRNLPPGMPGERPYISMRIRNWRERKL